MPDDFDPYYKWLGIPPKDQPPNYYRLLGIERFEEDREVIDAAANRLMAYLKSLSTGDDMDLSQKLLNEVAAARGCLLNLQRKAAYDADLAREVADRLIGDVSGTMGRSSATVPEPPPPQPPVISPAPWLIIASASQQSQPDPAFEEPVGDTPPGEHSPRKSRATLWITALLGVCLLVMAILMLWAPASRLRLSAGSHSHAEAAATTSRDANRSRVQSGPARLIFRWLPGDRANATLRINGKPVHVPPRGAVEHTLSPGVYQLEIERTGYETIRKRIVLSTGQDHPLELRWQPKTSGPTLADFAAMVQQSTDETAEVPPMPLPAAVEKPVAPKPEAERPQDNPPDNPPDSPPGRPPVAPASPTEAPEPRNTFAKLPSAIDLPPLAENSAGRILAIGPLDIANGDPLQVELLDGETVFKNGAKTAREFVLAPQEAPPAKASWLVQLRETSGDTISKQDNVARFWRDENVIRFQWIEGLDHRLVKRANYLRCCLVRLSQGEQEHQMTLLTPTHPQPLTIDLQQIFLREQAPLKWLPDPDDLLVEVTRVEGYEGCRFQQEAPARSWSVVFIRKGLLDVETSEAQFQFSMTAQSSAVCMLRMLSPPVDFWREWIPAKNPGPGNRKRPLVERYNRDELERARDEAKKSYNRARTEKTKQPHLLTYEVIDRQLWFLNFCEQAHQKAKIHYRIFFPVGTREVVLATTAP